MDAMLDHSSSLGIGPTEWLTIAARRNDERPRLAPADTDAQTFIIRLRGMRIWRPFWPGRSRATRP